MTDQHNYDRANRMMSHAADDFDALEDALPEIQFAQVRALLAVADELRALRELLAERLTKPEPVYYQLGADGPKIPLEGHDR